MRTHTYQYTSTTPVPASTPPEHRPNTDDTPTRSREQHRSVSRRLTAADVARIDATLVELELEREAQLASLPDARGDLVAIAHQESVARILAEIGDARRRLREGNHGVCADCHGTVTEERLEALPWATRCADCARRRYSWLR